MTNNGDVQVALLGPVEVRTDEGRRVVPSGARPRALLARLALDPGTVVATGTLVDALWGEDAPSSNALHTVVSRLRRTLAQDDDSADRLHSQAAGYLLDLRAEDVDALQAEKLAAQARKRLSQGAVADAEDLTSTALELWRGDPFADLDGASFAEHASARLHELRLDLRDLATEAALARGRAVDLTELAVRAEAYPLREHLQGLLVRALFAAGRQADALQAYERTRNALVEELGVDPSPELERIHLAVLRQEDTVLPQARDEGRRSNLRAQLTSFVGRDAEVDRITTALGESRLVTIVGPGGSGKTRLANETGTRVTDRFRDGVWFVELAPVHDPTDVPHAVLSALGMREQALLESTRMDPGHPPADPTERLVDNLRASELLVVLDNCEHLVSAIADLADRLLAACPEVRILATSREPLGITGETLSPLPPLADHAAVQLFTDRATAVRRNFTLDAETDGAVAEICRRLDGLPLAIELAAARIRALSAPQIAARLSDRFRLLTGGSRTAVPRHQTLLAVVDWSWDLLDKPERLLLQRISVFAGAVTLKDIERVCADDTRPESDVLDLLAALVEKSLVEPIGDATVRYRMLETIRAYATDRLVESGTADSLRERHADHLLTVVREAEPHLRGADQLTWLARLDDLRDDVTAALRWSTDACRADLAVGIAAWAGWYWVLRGMHGELLQHPEEALAVPGDVDPLPHVITNAYALIACFGRDGLDATRDRFVALLEQSEQCPDPNAHPLLALLPAMKAMFEPEQTEEGLRHLEHVASSYPDAWTRATARFAAGHVLDNLGRPEAALTAHEQAHAEYQAVGDRWGHSVSLSTLADIHVRHGEWERALACYREVDSDLRALATHGDIAMTLLRMASAQARSGDLEGAQASVAEARETAHRYTSSSQRTMADVMDAEVAHHCGDHERAYVLLTRALASAANVTDGPGEAQIRGAILVPLAHTQLRTGRVEEARRGLSEVVATTGPVPDIPKETLLIEQWADWATAVGRATDAARLLGSAEVLRGSATFSHHPDHDEIVRLIRAALCDETYARAYAEGTSRDRDQAREWARAWIAARS
ncbi:MAG: BTAD domain-containing putative transcriptional regulator [Streptosporangiales bacterium]